MGTIFQPLATYEMPPTYFPVTKVTSCFQAIVDAYGIARYREANPAVGCWPDQWPLASSVTCVPSQACPAKPAVQGRQCMLCTVTSIAQAQMSSEWAGLKAYLSGMPKSIVPEGTHT